MDEPTTLKVAILKRTRDPPQIYVRQQLWLRSEEGSYQLFWQAARKTLETLQKNLPKPPDPTDPTDPMDRRAERQRKSGQGFYTPAWQELGDRQQPLQPSMRAWTRGDGVNAPQAAREWRYQLELRSSFAVEVAGKTIILQWIALKGHVRERNRQVLRAVLAAQGIASNRVPESLLSLRLPNVPAQT